MTDPALPVETAPARGALPARVTPSWQMLLATVPPLYVLDQWTKWLVVRHIDPRGAIEIVPGWFDLVYWTNTGAAWGMLAGRSTFFLVIAVTALVVLTVLHRRGAFAGFWAGAGLCLLVPGILGNLTDRIARGAVVDFLSFNLHVPGAQPFPAFNVADSCICVAVGCFLIGSWREGQKSAGSSGQPPEAAVVDPR